MLLNNACSLESFHHRPILYLKVQGGCVDFLIEWLRYARIPKITPKEYWLGIRQRTDAHLSKSKSLSSFPKAAGHETDIIFDIHLELGRMQFFLRGQSALVTTAVIVIGFI